MSLQCQQKTLYFCAYGAKTALEPIYLDCKDKEEIKHIGLEWQNDDSMFYSYEYLNVDFWNLRRPLRYDRTVVLCSETCWLSVNSVLDWAAVFRSPQEGTLASCELFFLMLALRNAPGMLVCLPITSPAVPWRERQRALLKKCICAGLLRPPTRGVTVEAEAEDQSCFRNIVSGSDWGKGCAPNAKLRLSLEFMVELGVSICFSVIDMTYDL